MTAARTVAEAVAVLDGRIAAAGTDHDIGRRSGPSPVFLP